MILPTPPLSAYRNSSTLLLLPCSPTRRRSIPARCTTASSPPVQTSTPRPSSLTQRATDVQMNDLAA